MRVYPTGAVARNEEADGSVTVLNVSEVWCKSTESKPTNVADGSVAVEKDTGKVFFFDEDSSEWVEQFSFQS